MRHPMSVAAATAALALLILSAVPLALVSPARAADSKRTVVLSLQGLDCASCWSEIAPSLKKVKGVKKITFDRNKVEATVEIDQTADSAQLVAAVEKAGFKAFVGAGRGAYLPQEEFPAGSDVRLVTDRGDDVADLASIAATGKVTVVDFYAPWCGPCRQVAKHLAERLESDDKLAVRQINIVDWETPVAKHHLKGITGIPYVIVLDPAGKRVAAIQGLELEKLDAAIAKAGASL